jgi:hypothetical protein
MSGRQLFGIDKFRDTNKPLLAVLADPNSIFMSGLAKFARRSLYTNITNDRTAVHYTTGISKTDPYTDLSKVKLRTLPGFEDVILDPSDPVSPPLPTAPPTLPESLKKWTKRIPFILALTLFLPIGVVAYLVNAAIQTVRSSRRVSLHERGLAGIKVEDFRVNLWIKEIREAVEDAYENLNSAQGQEYLVDDGAATSGSGESGIATPASESDVSESGRGMLALERKLSRAQQGAGGHPTLALAPYQFAAIRELDKLGWRKYPVWIQSHRHSHAAIVVRSEKDGFKDGKVVLRHWASEEFLI